MTQLPGAQSRYLDARVTTASQPELALMLLDGAVRFGRQAQQLWDADDQRAECNHLLGRTLNIVEELTLGAAGGSTEASKRLEEEYAFAFRQLALAQLNHDAAALEAALKILVFHRGTWSLACEKLKSEAAPATRVPMPQLDASASSGQSLSLRA
jgi:flagellar secretion chaperone FliS